MGYYSDVRAILKKEDFEELKKQIEESENERLIDFTIEETREKGDYIYFGWDCIKWYSDVEWVEKFILSKEEHHFVRIGEDLTDIEESWELPGNVDCCICIRRCFDE